MHEYQARDLLVRYGCAVPKGIVASSEQEAEAAAKALGNSVVVKAQVLSGGRGKAGGVKFAASPEEARKAARDILSMNIKGRPVRRVLVVEALPQVKKEYYVALAVDRGLRCVRCIVSAAGGVDIEETARTNPGAIVSVPLPPFSRTRRFDDTRALAGVFGDRDLAASAAAAISSMIRLLNENDCSLVEVNPFIETKENQLVAADAKIVVDDNALFKHPGLEALRNDEEYGEDERAAQRAGLSFVGLDGSIGCMVNGAGLAMATMDLIQGFGARPANFLDVGGSSSPQKVLNAFTILMANTNIKVILVNIFGGITRCDDIARGILLARRQLGITTPMAVRLVGTNDKEGRALLAGEGIAAESDMVAAIRSAVAMDGAAK